MDTTSVKLKIKLSSFKRNDGNIKPCDTYGKYNFNSAYCIHYEVALTNKSHDSIV